MGSPDAHHHISGSLSFVSHYVENQSKYSGVNGRIHHCGVLHGCDKGFSQGKVLIVHKTEVKRSSPRQTFSTVTGKKEASCKTRFNKCNLVEGKRKFC